MSSVEMTVEPKTLSPALAPAPSLRPLDELGSHEHEAAEAVITQIVGDAVSDRADLQGRQTVIEEALYCAWQRRSNEVMANTLDDVTLRQETLGWLASKEAVLGRPIHAGVKERVVSKKIEIARQAAVDFVRLNGSIPLQDKYDFMFDPEHPVRAFPVGHVDNVADWQATDMFEEKIAAFFAAAKARGENVRLIPREEAEKALSIDDQGFIEGGFLRVIRRRDLGVLIREANEVPEHVSRKTTLRKRSEFLLDLTHPQITSIVEALHNTEQWFATGLTSATQSQGTYNRYIFGDKSGTLGDRLGAGMHLQREVLRGLIETLIKERSDRLVPISTSYYFYNPHKANRQPAPTLVAKA